MRPAMYWGIAGLVVVVGCIRWIVIALRAPEFVYAGRICAKAGRVVGTQTYWRRVLRDYVLIRQTVDINGLVRRVEMLCPRLTEEVLSVFTTPSGGEWLEAATDHKWSVRKDHLRKLGDRFDGIEVSIDSDPTFGARIIAVRKAVHIERSSDAPRRAG